MLNKDRKKRPTIAEVLDSPYLGRQSKKSKVRQLKQSGKEEAGGYAKLK